MLFKDIHTTIFEIGNYVRLHSKGNCTDRLKDIGLGMKKIIHYYYYYDYAHSCNVVI